MIAPFLIRAVLWLFLAGYGVLVFTLDLPFPGKETMQAAKIWWQERNFETANLYQDKYELLTNAQAIQRAGGSDEALFFVAHEFGLSPAASGESSTELALTLLDLLRHHPQQAAEPHTWHRARTLLLTRQLGHFPADSATQAEAAALARESLRILLITGGGPARPVGLSDAYRDYLKLPAAVRQVFLDQRLGLILQKQD